jgi:4-amino-4-deoxy-L-arabinose transferase-like glycosyltransferase
LFLLIVLPWHVIVSIKNPEFFEKYIITEHIIRYCTDFHSRTARFWFFIPVFLVGFVPWSFFLFLIPN